MAALLAVPDAGSTESGYTFSFSGHYVSDGVVGGPSGHVKVFSGVNVALGDGSVRSIGDVIAPPPSAAATDYFFTIEGVKGETVDRSAPATGAAVKGGLGFATLTVGTGGNRMIGGAGNDILVGGEAPDILIGHKATPKLLLSCSTGQH